MTDSFFKYPSTPHLALLEGLSVRDDKVLSDFEKKQFLQHKIIVEEKIDGANLGISFDPAGNMLFQNRGSLLQVPFSGQWKKLTNWTGNRLNNLFDQLSDRYILFGEWCYAKHSISYENLPDWFLGFDIFDKKESKFFSCKRRDQVFNATGISPVPELAYGKFTLKELTLFLQQSKFSHEPAEGLYLRIDSVDWLNERAKLVRPAFVQSVNKHWSQYSLEANKLSKVGNR